MKSLIQTVSALLIAGAFLVGCGQKEEEAPMEAPAAEEMAPAGDMAAPAAEESSEPGGWDPSTPVETIPMEEPAAAE